MSGAAKRPGHKENDAAAKEKDKSQMSLVSSPLGNSTSLFQVLSLLCQEKNCGYCPRSWFTMVSLFGASSLDFRSSAA